jgi:hypothetical protein
MSLDTTRMSTMPQKYRKRQSEMSNNVYEFSKIYDSTKYLHASAFSPVKYTFIKSIEDVNFTTWSNLTAQNVKQYLDKSEAMIKGHKNHQRKNLRSTRPKLQKKSRKLRNLR